MTRTLKVYNGEDQTPITDITDMVEWPECEFGQRAHLGESTLSNLRFRDEEGRVGNSSGLPAGLTPFSLNAHNVVIWQQSGFTMGRMRISPKDWTRGAQVAGRAREAEVTLEDYNSDLRNIVVHGYTRPVETDKARVQGVLASYLSGSPRRTTNLNGSNYVSSSNTITLPATTYNRTNAAEVLGSIAAASNKQYFVTIDGELFYDGNDSTAYSCPFKISDRDTDHSATVVGPAPGGFGPASSEDGQQLLSGIWLFYGESQYVHVTNPTVANQYSWWEDVVYDDTVTTAAQATVVANATLAQRQTEDRQISVRIGPLTYGQAIQIKAGQLIQIKWRAIPDADDAYVSRRITELRWSTPEPFSFFADMILDRPIRLHGQGQKIDTVIPKGAPAPVADIAASDSFRWSFNANSLDDVTQTWDIGLDWRSTYWAPADAAFGAGYGRNAAGFFRSTAIPASASTGYIFSCDAIWEYDPAIRGAKIQWLNAALVLREDLFIDGPLYGTGTEYHPSVTLTSPATTTHVRFVWTNLAGFYADNVAMQLLGTVTDDDPYALPASGASPYYMKSDDTRVLGLLDQMEKVGFSWKMPARVATTAAGTLATAFEDGDTIDGVVLAAGDRILIKDQAAGATNGIYTVNATGAPTRAVDFTSDGQAVGAAAFVSEGTTNGNKVYVCTTDAPITLGTTALVFAQVSGGSSSLIVQEDDVTVDAAATTLDFTTALNVTSSPAGEANVAVDLGTAATQAATGNHTHTAGDSSKASGTADITTTTTAADCTGATLSLTAGTYIVVANFDAVVNNALNDRLFEGILDVGGTDENDLAVLNAPGLVNVRAPITQVWRVVLGSTTTVKLQARHSGGTVGDFTVRFDNTTITAFTSGGGAGLGVWTTHAPTWTTTGTAPAIGNGTLTARYKALDASTYLYYLNLIAGSTTTFGTGTWSFNLPITPVTGRRQILAGHILDSGTDNKLAATTMTGGTASIPDITAEGANVVTNTVPMTWAVNDHLILSGIIEV